MKAIDTKPRFVPICHKDGLPCGTEPIFEDQSLNRCRWYWDNKIIERCKELRRVK